MRYAPDARTQLRNDAQQCRRARGGVGWRCGREGLIKPMALRHRMH